MQHSAGDLAVRALGRDAEIEEPRVGLEEADGVCAKRIKLADVEIVQDSFL